MEFEKAFALEEDSEEPSGTNTPAVQDEKMESGTPTPTGPGDASEKGDEKEATDAAQPSTELPPEVRSKLRKLGTLESKYKGL